VQGLAGFVRCDFRLCHSQNLSGIHPVGQRDNADAGIGFPVHQCPEDRSGPPIFGQQGSVYVNRAFGKQFDHFLADFLAERDDHKQIRFTISDLLYHGRGVDILRFCAGDLFFFGPAGHIRGFELPMPAGRPCGLGEQTGQLMP